MLTRVTRSKARAKAITASRAVGTETRTLTRSFKIRKDAVARNSTLAKVAVTAASATSVKKTTRTTSISSTTATALEVGNILEEKPVAATDDSPGCLSPSSHTPQQLLAQGLLHLRTVSPALARWIDNEDYSHILTGHLRKPDDPPPNYFRSLARGIISQQVSGAAAASILRKFTALFYTANEAAPDPPAEFFPTPQQVLDRAIPELRTAGLSERKAQYMQSLATEFLTDPSLPELHTLSNEDVIEKLTKVKGIGIWSVQMFLIFSLGRWDVFSTGDLGIQRGMAVWDGRDVESLKRAAGAEGVKKVAAKWKYMSEGDMLRLSESFRPWRSLFCLVMWKASDTLVGSMKEKVVAKGKRAKGKAKAKAKEEDEVIEETE